MDRPLLIYDGECSFCRRAITRWQDRTGERVRYLPYARTSYAVRRLVPREAAARSVLLVEPSGRVSKGAAAVFRALGHAPGLRERGDVPRAARSRGEPPANRAAGLPRPRRESARARRGLVQIGTRGGAHDARQEGVGGADPLSLLMEARDEETGEGMNDQQLRDEVVAMLVGGHEFVREYLPPVRLR